MEAGGRPAETSPTAASDSAGRQQDDEISNTQESDWCPAGRQREQSRRMCCVRGNNRNQKLMFAVCFPQCPISYTLIFCNISSVKSIIKYIYISIMYVKSAKTRKYIKNTLILFSFDLLQALSKF